MSESCHDHLAAASEFTTKTARLAKVPGCDSGPTDGSQGKQAGVDVPQQAAAVEAGNGSKLKVRVCAEHIQVLMRP
jgi:hypothetical protein